MKIKKISFLPEFIPMIKSGKKTVTRRIKKKDLEIYYFTGGRTGRKEGYIEVLDCRKVKLASSFFRPEMFDGSKDGMKTMVSIEVTQEGFNNLEEFIECWNKIVVEKYKFPVIPWDSDPEVYRIEFRYLKNEPCWSVRDQIENNKLLEEHQKKIKDLAYKVCVMLPISMEDALRFVMLTDNGVGIMKIYDEYMEEQENEQDKNRVG